MKKLQGLLCWMRWLALACLLAGAASSCLAAKTYSDNGDGTVTDPTTGLTWMRCSMGQTWDGPTCTGDLRTFTWGQAIALSGAVTFAVQSDWRMPNIRELSTISDLSMYQPAVDRQVFPNTSSYLYWSSSPGVYYSDSAYAINFEDGKKNSYGQNGSFGVRLVRGQASNLMTVDRPTSDYVDLGGGTVIHTPSGLTWMRCSMGQSWNGTSCTGNSFNYTWKEAIAFTGTTTFMGYSDWRVPNQVELESLVDYSKRWRLINETIFPSAMSPDWWWSSTADANDADSAWLVTWSGYSSKAKQSNYVGYGVRLVRDGPASGFHSLSVSKSGTGSGALTSNPAGVNCGTTCKAFFSGNVGITLTATPTTGSTFAGWAGACLSAGTSATCTVTMDAAKDVTANFTVTGHGAIQFQPGWNLVGNRQSQPLTVASAFGVAAQVNSVWKWVPVSTRWAFYTPTQTDGGAAYAVSHGYDTLATIEAGEGFWVDAKAAFTAQLPLGTAVTDTSFQGLSSGWHLISTGDTKTPGAFNTDVAVTTLWAWDNAQSKWYFYAPSLDAQGGTALSDYITAHDYLDFRSANKTLGPGVGFWVNKP